MGRCMTGGRTLGKSLLDLVLGGGSISISTDLGIQGAEHSLPHHAGQGRAQTSAQEDRLAKAYHCRDSWLHLPVP